MSAANVVRAIASSDIDILNEALTEMRQNSNIKNEAGNNRHLNTLLRKSWVASKTSAKNLQISIAKELNRVFYTGGRPHTLLDEALQVAAEEASNKGHPSVEIVRILIKHGAKTYYQLTTASEESLEKENPPLAKEKPPLAKVKPPLAKIGTRRVNPLTGIRSFGGRRSSRRNRLRNITRRRLSR